MQPWLWLVVVAVLAVPAFSIAYEASGSWRRVAVAAAAVALLIGVAYWLWWALWDNQQKAGSPATDRWLNVMLGLGAASAVLAFLGGAYTAARYGRRASISVSAKTMLHTSGVVLSVRPKVRAIGIFRVRFHGPRGAVIRVAEWYVPAGHDSALGLNPQHPEAPALERGRVWEHAAVFGEPGGREEQFAEGGEELSTTSDFLLPLPSPSTVGWSVNLFIVAPSRWFPGSSGSWADRVFVPRPDAEGIV
jgi:uncharacterized membrane protein